MQLDFNCLSKAISFKMRVFYSMANISADSYTKTELIAVFDYATSRLYNKLK